MLILTLFMSEKMDDDYSKTTELHKRYHNFTTESCAKEKLDILVKVKISDKKYITIAKMLRHY